LRATALSCARCSEMVALGLRAGGSLQGIGGGMRMSAWREDLEKCHGAFALLRCALDSDPTAVPGNGRCKLPSSFGLVARCMSASDRSTVVRSQKRATAHRSAVLSPRAGRCRSRVRRPTRCSSTPGALGTARTMRRSHRADRPARAGAVGRLRAIQSLHSASPAAGSRRGLHQPAAAPQPKNRQAIRMAATIPTPSAGGPQPVACRVQRMPTGPMWIVST